MRGGCHNFWWCSTVNLKAHCQMLFCSQWSWWPGAIGIWCTLWWYCTVWRFVCCMTVHGKTQLIPSTVFFPMRLATAAVTWCRRSSHVLREKWWFSIYYNQREYLSLGAWQYSFPPIVGDTFFHQHLLSSLVPCFSHNVSVIQLWSYLDQWLCCFSVSTSASLMSIYTSSLVRGSGIWYWNQLLRR